MVQPIGAQLGVNDVIATRMKAEDGRYTGEIAFYAAGPAKVEAVRKLAAERGYDLDDCLRLFRLRVSTYRCWPR
jgi:phosphoserine phosphatase